MKKKINAFLQLFIDYQGDVPSSDETPKVHNEAIWELEQLNIIRLERRQNSRGGRYSVYKLTEKASPHLHKMIAFEGDLREYPFA